MLIANIGGPGKDETQCGWKKGDPDQSKARELLYNYVGQRDARERTPIWRRQLFKATVHSALPVPERFDRRCDVQAFAHVANHPVLCRKRDRAAACELSASQRDLSERAKLRMVAIRNPVPTC